MRSETDPAYKDASGILRDRLGNPILPKKQNLTEDELSKQNIRGYAAFVQDLFVLYPDEIIWEAKAKTGYLFREGKTMDPLEAIHLDPSKTRDLIEGVEVALNSMGRPRNQQAIRLYYGLDQEDGQPMSMRRVGEIIKDQSGEKPITGSRVQDLISIGITVMHHLDIRRPLSEKLWGSQQASR